MYNEDIDGVTIDPLGQDVHAGQSRTPPTRRYNKRVGNVWSAKLVLMGVPKAERDRQGIDADRRPPGGLVAVAMELAVMKATDRDRELVADFPAVAVNVFLTGRFLWTKSAASSSDWRSARSAMSCSRSAAACSAARSVREGGKLGSLRLEAALRGGARSAADDGAPGTAATALACVVAPSPASGSIFALRSGASRLSSPAMPTSVNSA